MKNVYEKTKSETTFKTKRKNYIGDYTTGKRMRKRMKE
jgi:hypothetical protein